MRLLTIALTGLLVTSNACAGWLTFGGKIHSDTTDTVTGVQSQQLVNVELGLANEAALRAGGDVVAMTNYVAALTAEAQARASGDLVAMTNWQARVNTLTNGAALGETALQPAWAETGTVFRATEVIGAQSTLIETAWQNPASAADWTWTSNGREITLTGYSGPNAVVIPDMLDGLPVTGFGEVFRENVDIVSVGGGANIKAVGDFAFEICGSLTSVSLPACTTVGNYAFDTCEALNSVSLPACTTVGDFAFYNCWSLNSVSLPACTTVGDSAFDICGALNSVSLPACTTVGDYAFYNCWSLNSVSLPACITVGNYAFSECEALNSVTFGQNAPAQAEGVFELSTPTIYVSNPHATGWGDTWNGRPVVRLPLYADAIYQAGELVATEAHVAQAIAAIPEPDLSDHPTFAQVAASNALPYTAWTGTITPANGTATVSIAHGNMPVLVTTAPCVLTLNPTGYGTAGVSRVSLSYYTGTNSFTFATNIIDYAATPTVDTNGWNTLLIRRVSNGAWKGVGL